MQTNDAAAIYSIPSGTSCRVRADAEAEWKPFRTTRDLEFSAHGVADNGGTWTFRIGSWEMKVSPRFVAGRDPKPKKPRETRGTFNTTILGRNGRGTNRRKNRRR